jgi:lipopolysaccharide transport system permease protein
MLYHDIEMGLGIALSFWFFITPIAYATPDSGILAVLNNWNPLSPLLTTARAWLLGTPTHEIGTFAGMTAATLVLFVVALTAYRVAMPHIIKRTQD